MIRWVSIILCFSQPAWSKALFEAKERQSYISESISSLTQVPPKKIREAKAFVDTLGHSLCASSFVGIKVSCLVESSKSFCQQSGGSNPRYCHQVMDILMANKMHEDRFLSKRERYEIMKDHRDFRSALDQRLTQRYGALTTSFVMAPEFSCRQKEEPCFAESLDNFCLRWNEEGRQSWQTCVAAIVWFVAKPSVQ